MPSARAASGSGCSKRIVNSNLRFVVVERVGVVVVGGICSVQALEPLFLFLHEVGVGAGAGGGRSGQPAVGPWLIPGWDRRRGRWSRGRGGDRNWDLGRDRDGDWSRNVDSGCTGAVGAVVGVVGGGVVVLLMVLVVVEVVAVVEGDGGGRLGQSLAVVVVVVVVVLRRNGSGCGLSGRRRWRRRRERRLGWRSRWRRSDRLPIQTQVLVLLAEPVQLDLQLLNPAPLGF